MADRLLKKTAEQQSTIVKFTNIGSIRIRGRLTSFAKCRGGLNERIENGLQCEGRI